MTELPQHRLIPGQTRYVSFESVTRNRVHRHSFFEPCIVISGSGEFEHGTDVYPLRAGDLFIADRGVYHEIRSVESRDLELFFLAFQLVPVRDAGPVDGWSSPQTIGRFLANHRAHLAGQSHLVPLFEHLLRLVRRNPDFQGDPDYRDGSLFLLRQVLSALASTASLSDSDYSEQLQQRRIADFIESHLHQPIRLRDIAGACAMSERTLRRRWGGWSQHSLPEEVTRRRIDRACQLLLLPDISIADVGYQVGIPSAARFSRLFKATRGVTPREYRQRFLDELPAALSGEHETEYLEGS